MKVLIGVDESRYSSVAVEAVAGRMWKPNTQVKIVSAVDDHLHLTPEGDDDNHYEVARQAVDEAVNVLRQSTNQFEISGEIVEGSAKEAILDEAEKWGADLIVVGSHGRRGLSRFLLGSVSQAVALHANCSVEIVRAPKEAEA